MRTQSYYLSPVERIIVEMDYKACWIKAYGESIDYNMGYAKYWIAAYLNPEQVTQLREELRVPLSYEPPNDLWCYGNQIMVWYRPGTGEYAYIYSRQENPYV